MSSCLKCMVALQLARVGVGVRVLCFPVCKRHVGQLDVMLGQLCMSRMTVACV